jgi:glyoxylase-like metal-dependent hydrolase (beta-lactamase superfamily II)
MRTARAICAAATVMAAGLLFIGAAQAAAPMVKKQAPGYYRMMLGDFEITALADGSLPLKASELLTHASPVRVGAALARAFLTEPVETSVNGYLINTGAKLVLVDTGAGNAFGPSLGKLAANLQASGYTPEQVDEVYITHMHGDHVGGLMAGVRLAFPNATVRADRHEADYWLSREKMNAAPQDARAGFERAMAVLNPYVEAGRFKPFDGDTELVPGVRAVARYGHTPGHTIYVVESKGETLVLWGDLLHVAAVQFGEPSVTIKYDTDPKAAAAERGKAFAAAAREGCWVGAAHLAFPGIGHVRAEGKAYAFVPANYTQLH